MTEQHGHGIDQLPPPDRPVATGATAATPQVNRVSSYVALRVLVSIVALVALAAITLVLGVVGPNRWILISLFAGGTAGLVLGGVTMQILQPAPARPSDQGDSGRSPWEEFLRELDRCRRYDLTFTLARIPCLPQEPELAGRGRSRRSRRERLADLNDALRPHLRSTDLSWADGLFVYALLPRMDRELCGQLVDRIDHRNPGLIARTGVAYASFPQDGLTSNALLAALDRPAPENAERRSAS